MHPKKAELLANPDCWLIVAQPPIVIEVGKPAPIALPPAPEAVVFSGEPEGDAIVITQPIPDHGN